MHCYFHLVNQHEIIPDEVGVEVLDLERAQELALLAIQDIRKAALDLDASWHQGWRLDIVTPSGQVLASIPLDPVVH
ncbi:hypothetical protein KBI52_16960 [Microvirga sp. HBU67558]|nr:MULTISPECIES: hypothetical protein [unclassified Microvirga]MBQ0821885.1 hypothetical protein [Microvirga sp. HBU67558]